MLQFTLEILVALIIVGGAFVAGLLQGESQMKRHMENERKNG